MVRNNWLVTHVLLIDAFQTFPLSDSSHKVSPMLVDLHFNAKLNSVCRHYSTTHAVLFSAWTNFLAVNQTVFSRKRTSARHCCYLRHKLSVLYVDAAILFSAAYRAWYLTSSFCASEGAFLWIPRWIPPLSIMPKLLTSNQKSAHALKPIWSCRQAFVVISSIPMMGACPFCAKYCYNEGFHRSNLVIIGVSQQELPNTLVMCKFCAWSSMIVNVTLMELAELPKHWISVRSPSTVASCFEQSELWLLHITFAENTLA